MDNSQEVPLWQRSLHYVRDYYTPKLGWRGHRMPIHNIAALPPRPESERPWSRILGQAPVWIAVSAAVSALCHFRTILGLVLFLANIAFLICIFADTISRNARKRAKKEPKPPTTWHQRAAKNGIATAGVTAILLRQHATLSSWLYVCALISLLTVPALTFQYEHRLAKVDSAQTSLKRFQVLTTSIVLLEAALTALAVSSWGQTGLVVFVTMILADAALLFVAGFFQYEASQAGATSY